MLATWNTICVVVSHHCLCAPEPVPVTCTLPRYVPSHDTAGSGPEGTAPPIWVLGVPVQPAMAIAEMALAAMKYNLFILFTHLKLRSKGWITPMPNRYRTLQ